MKAKKFVALVLALCMACTMAACGGNNNSSTSSGSSAAGGGKQCYRGKQRR